MPFGPAPKGLDKRLADWDARLAALVNANRNRRHAYARFDCIAFAQEAVHAVTGVTLLPGIELPTGSWLSCARFLIQHGLDNFEELACAALGQARGLPDESTAGDLVSWQISGELHLAVRVGSEAVTPAEAGFMVISRPKWISAWTVGR